jgi:hypothetical protein
MYKYYTWVSSALIITFLFYQFIIPWNTKASDGEIIGLYHRSLYEMRVNMLNGDKKLADHWAEINTVQFSELKARNLISPIGYKFDDPREFDSFHKACSEFFFFRSGYSNEGGQWPTGVEYIESQFI